MKYMLLIYGNQTTWEAMSADGGDAVMRAHAAMIADLRESGELIDTQGLTTAGARTVRVVAEGVPAVTDGPFTEAKEVLAGYYLVDCAGLERATQIAARLPEARHSPIEIRQVMGTSEIEAGLRA